MDDLRIQEDLHLSRGSGPALFVPEEVTAKLARHQIEGLRFLYRQFIKKKPGVILNDPSGYGKKAQITIFLNIIKHVVTQPMLVLCNKTEICKWKHNFCQWTDVDNDIIYESNSPYTNKKIFVNTFDYISDFSRRDWSVVVVDDPVSLKLFKPLRSLRPAFRIWIVSIDLKAHFNTFEAIHEWVRPASAFPRQMFVADKSNIQDVIEKAILLDSYFEDIVLRRGSSKLGESQPDPIFKPVAKVSRKNKDPTGTKVKRSKKRINDEQNIESSSKSCNKTKVKNKRIIDDDDDGSLIIKRNTEVNEVDKDNDSAVTKKSRRIIEDYDVYNRQITKRNRRMIIDDDNESQFTTNNEESKITNHDNNEIQESFSRNDGENDHKTEFVVNPEERNVRSKDNDSTESSQEMRLNLDLSNHSENEIGPENKAAILNQINNETEFDSGIKDALAKNEVSNTNEKILDKITNNIDFIKDNELQDSCKKSTDLTVNNSIEGNIKDNLQLKDIENDLNSGKDIEITKLNDNINIIDINTQPVSASIYNKESQLSNDSNSSDGDVLKMTENILTNVFFSSPNSKKAKKNDESDSEPQNKYEDSKIIKEKNEINFTSDNDGSNQSEKEKSFDEKIEELQTSILDSLF